MVLGPREDQEEALAARGVPVDREALADREAPVVREALADREAPVDREAPAGQAEESPAVAALQAVCSVAVASAYLAAAVLWAVC